MGRQREERGEVGFSSVEGTDRRSRLPSSRVLQILQFLSLSVDELFLRAHIYEELCMLQRDVQLSSIVLLISIFSFLFSPHALETFFSELLTAEANPFQVQGSVSSSCIRQVLSRMSKINCWFTVKRSFGRVESLNFFIQTHGIEMGDRGQKPVVLLSDSPSSWALLGDIGQMETTGDLLVHRIGRYNFSF